MTTRPDPEDVFLSLLSLTPTGVEQWQTRRLDANLNGRVFGGQLLAHAVVAAQHNAPARHLASLRLGFLQGALPDVPIHWAASTLQEGSRITTRHLRATQGSRVIADAQVSLQLPAPAGFDHADALPPGVPPPDEVPTLAETEQAIARKTGRPCDLQRRPFLDLRLIDAEAFLLQPTAVPALRWWVKVRERLPDDPHLHAAALAYLSDFWLNAAAIAPHVALAGARDRIYASSLNHSLWSYAPCRADEWMLFDTISPRAAEGRGLAWGRVFTQEGRLVACAAQEMLCTKRDAAR